MLNHLLIIGSALMIVRKFTHINNYKETKDMAINIENFSQKVLSFYYRIKCDDYWKHFNLNFQVSFVDYEFRHS